MSLLTEKHKKRLEKAAGKSEAILKKTRAEITKSAFKKWARSNGGCYGGLNKDENGNIDSEAAQALVDRAWQQLIKILDERIRYAEAKKLNKTKQRLEKLRQAMTDYVDGQGQHPRFDTTGRVADTAGGITSTTWRKIPGGFEQTGSSTILVGKRWICLTQSSKYAIKRLLQTLVHEFAGHWLKNGQKIEIDPNFTDEEAVAKRKEFAEERADKITNQYMQMLKKSPCWKELCKALEKEATERKAEQKKAIDKEIDEFLASLEKKPKDEKED